MRSPLVPASFLIAFVAWASILPPGAPVKIVGDSAEVAGCRSLGMVSSTRPVAFPRDGRMTQMQNKTARMGGNVLFVTAHDVTGTGTAYRCGPEASPASDRHP